MNPETIFRNAFIGMAIACLSSWACAAEVVYDVSEVSRKPSLHARSEWPVAPEKMAKKGEAATVELQFVVRANGKVSDVKAVSSSDESWAKTCVREVSKWIYKPAKKEGKDVDCRMTFSIKFDPSLIGSDKVFDLSEVDMLPRMTDGAGHVTQGTTGSITAIFVVNAKGRIEDVEIIEASDREASALGRRMISAMRYKPATKDGVAVKCRMKMPVAWTPGSR